MKCIVILFSILLVGGQSVFCQNNRPYYRAWTAPNPPVQPLHTYGANTMFPTLMIADDFGPRRNGDPYEWHGGIDYNAGTGDNELGDLAMLFKLVMLAHTAI